MKGERSGINSPIEIYNISNTQAKVDLPTGQQSSIKSPGLAGKVNRVLATVFKQEDADIIAFINHISGKNSD